MRKQTQHNNDIRPPTNNWGVKTYLTSLFMRKL